MKEFPLEMQIDEETVVEFAIPSWHINAHGSDCRADFRLSFGMELAELVVKK